MAQTRSGYRLIDDSEVDADSPITQSLVTALRDQWVGLSASAGSLPNSERVRVPEKLQHNTSSGLIFETSSSNNIVTRGTGFFSVGAAVQSGSSVSSLVIDTTINEISTRGGHLNVAAYADVGGTSYTYNFHLLKNSAGTFVGNAICHQAVGSVNGGTPPNAVFNMTCATSIPSANIWRVTLSGATYNSISAGTSGGSY